MADSTTRATYPIILVAFDVEESPDGKKVTFQQAKNPKVTNNTKARFLKNVKERSTTDANPNNSEFAMSGQFDAELVTDEEEIARLLMKQGQKKPLFCIHGWQGRPDIWIRMCKNAQPNFEDTNYNLIPILWPANDNDIFTALDAPLQQGFDYIGSRRDASFAGRVLSEVFDSIPPNVEMDIVAVSMGNFVLEELAKARSDTNKKFAFDNIFMSAADVRGDMFNLEEGQHIIDMLSSNANGKVYVFQNENDTLLKFTTLSYPDYPLESFGVPLLLNLRRRIPRLGLRQEWSIIYIKDKVEYVQVRLDDVPNRFDVGAQHGYLFDDFAIKFYKDKCVGFGFTLMYNNRI